MKNNYTNEINKQLGANYYNDYKINFISSKTVTF